MYSRSKTYDYINGLEVVEQHDDHVVKIANAQDLIAKLPSPKNLERNMDLVPSVLVTLTLSNSSQLPEHIFRAVSKSENNGFFTDKSLLGLCMSGRGLPLEVFLHDYFMMNYDPSGEIFEEVIWHEIVHGIEGVYIDGLGKVRRKTPWSYEVQQHMLMLDEQSGHEVDWPSCQKEYAYVRYMRSGTSLQDNVSEVFARAAVIYMYQIKETGMAPLCSEEFFLFIENFNGSKNASSRKESNIYDFISAWRSYSDESRAFFTREFDNAFLKISELYGCCFSSA